MSGNCLRSVPAGALSGLTSLTDLTLAGNGLTALPPGELAPLTRLRKLALNGNCLGSLKPADLGAGPGLGLGVHMAGLTELMLQVGPLTVVQVGSRAGVRRVSGIGCEERAATWYVRYMCYMRYMRAGWLIGVCMRKWVTVCMCGVMWRVVMYGGEWQDGRYVRSTRWGRC